MKVLIVDDNHTYLMLLRSVVHNIGNHAIFVFSNPLEALEAAGSTEFDLVLVDYMMPEMDGIAFIQALRQLPNHRDQPIVMVTTAEQRETRIAALDAGATDFLRKPIEPVELRVRVQNLLNLREAQTAMRDKAAWLAREVRQATYDLSESQRDMARRLARAIECRDGHTGDHVARMAALCRLIAEGLGLDEKQCDTIYAAAPMHDVGKIGIPDFILQKPSRLSDEEMAVMRTHVSIGEAILANGRSALMRCAERIASSHHERWDGQGYPRGLAGDAIPIEGRIAAVADVFEALCADRVYRPGQPIETARAFIRSGSGRHFDPACVAAFEANWNKIAALMQAPSSQAASPAPVTPVALAS
jgi:putative two-component system response regulator